MWDSSKVEIVEQEEGKWKLRERIQFATAVTNSTRISLRFTLTIQFNCKSKKKMSTSNDTPMLTVNHIECTIFMITISQFNSINEFSFSNLLRSSLVDFLNLIKRILLLAVGRLTFRHLEKVEQAILISHRKNVEETLKTQFNFLNIFLLCLIFDVFWRLLEGERVRRSTTLRKY